MENYKMQTEAVRLAYETPDVQVTHWEEDILAGPSNEEIGGNAGEMGGWTSGLD